MRQYVGTHQYLQLYMKQKLIDNLITSLWANNEINNKCKVQSRIPSQYDANNYLEVLGWHKTMKTNTDTLNRERYYVFTLSVHIVKILSGLSKSDIERQYGEEVRMLHDISKSLVDSYFT